MKMILFRPTFVATVTTLQAIALLCIFSSIASVSAVPQFGRPQVHVLDEAIPSTEPAVPVTDQNDTSSVVPAQTSGASYSLGGGVHAALVLSAAASAVMLAF